MMNLKMMKIIPCNNQNQAPGFFQTISNNRVVDFSSKMVWIEEGRYFFS